MIFFKFREYVDLSIEEILKFVKILKFYCIKCYIYYIYVYIDVSVRSFKIWSLVFKGVLVGEKKLLKFFL